MNFDNYVRLIFFVLEVHSSNSGRQWECVLAPAPGPRTSQHPDSSAAREGKYIGHYITV